MRLAAIAITVTFIGTSNLLAALKTKTIEYKQGDTVLEGYLAWDDSSTAKRPAVIVVHEWWGNNDYSHKRAEMLAGLGYVGFAVDVFGKGKQTTDPKQATEWATAIRNDIPTGLARLQAGLDTLKAQPRVDTDRIAAIGYCFGGSCVLHMARNNFPLRGVVSFHGSLAGGSPNPQPIKPKILACHGANDTFESPEEVNAFMEEMKKANADWQFNIYSGAVHAFTNPDADKFGIPGVAYNKEADQRSWQAMRDFFAEILK